MTPFIGNKTEQMSLRGCRSYKNLLWQPLLRKKGEDLQPELYDGGAMDIRMDSGDIPEYLRMFIGQIPQKMKEIER